MTPPFIEIGILSQAAVAVHDLLSKHKLTYAFFGGFELVILNQPDRTSKDVDVEIVKPRSLFGGSSTSGFEKVKAAFKSDEIFHVFDGNKDDAVRQRQHIVQPHTFIIVRYRLTPASSDLE